MLRVWTLHVLKFYFLLLLCFDFCPFLQFYLVFFIPLCVSLHMSALIFDYREAVCKMRQCGSLWLCYGSLILCRGLLIVCLKFNLFLPLPSGVLEEPLVRSSELGPPIDPCSSGWHAHTGRTFSGFKIIYDVGEYRRLWRGETGLIKIHYMHVYNIKHKI